MAFPRSILILLALAGFVRADVTTGLIFSAPCQNNAASTNVVATPADGTLTGAGNTIDSSVPGPGKGLPLALEFDGSNDYATTPSVTASGQAATYAMFVKLDGNQGAFDGLLFCRGSGSNVCGLHISDADGRELACTWNDNPSTYFWNSVGIIPDNVWCLVAAAIRAMVI